MATRHPISALAGFDGGLDDGAPIRELDRVRVLEPVTGDGDEPIPAGSTGTVVGIYAQGAAFEVEFTEPVDALATIEARSLLMVERADG